MLVLHHGGFCDKIGINITTGKESLSADFGKTASYLWGFGSKMISTRG